MKVDYIHRQSFNKLRHLAVNTLITIFIIMSYFYLSEIFGSISSPFITSNNFEIVFGISLIIYTFFSILSGSIQAFISGFLGELFYQLAFYDTIVIYWCVIVGIFGLVCGLYKYKPLKYQRFKNLWYSFLILVINSILFMLLVIIFQFVYNIDGFSFEEIIINFGLKSLIECVLSIAFLIPFLLFIYDKFLASKERHIYNLLLTHHPVESSDHTFVFQFGRTYIYFCSRCSGMIIGLILSIFFIHLIEMIYNSLFDPFVALILIIILPIPGLVDWGTQRLLLRSSSTSSRVFTGFIIGVSMHLISFTGDFYFFSLMVITIYFSILFFLIYIGQKRLLRQLDEELTPQPPEKQDEE